MAGQLFLLLLSKMAKAAQWWAGVGFICEDENGMNTGG